MEKALHGKLKFAALLLASVLVILAMATPSSAASDCGICHGVVLTDMRPVDTPSASLSSYRNITTGAFKGNHQTHMPLVVPSTPSATSGGACTKCHGNTVGYTPNGTAHRSGTINLNSNINGSPTAALYGGITTFKNQTSVPSLATCTNVNCHFQTTTPTWGSASFTYTNPTTNDCDKCHGNGGGLAAPQDRSHPGQGKHGTYYGTDTGSCAKCHPSYTTFTHSTSAQTGGRNLSLQGTDLAPANYSLPANLAYPAYMTNAALNRNGTCTNLYCHSNGTRNAAAYTATAVPTWGVNTLTCASCHGYKVGSFSVLTSGSHKAHINSAFAGRTGKDFSCDQCHKATTSDGATISTTANHVNRIINVNMTTSSVGVYSNPNHLPGGAFGSCTNTTCHNVGRTGTSGAALTVTWGTAAGANKCAICHGAGNAVGSPDYTSGAGGSATANSHTTHAITKGISCSVCHIQTTTNGTAIIAGGGKHLDNSNQDVSFGTFNGQAQGSAVYTPGLTFKTCATTYCHFSASPQWGGAVLGCAGCHGDQSTAATLSGKHAAHVNPGTYFYWRGAGSSIGCVECHSATVSSNAIISNQANHVNGVKNYSGAKAYKTASPVTNCVTYCHTNGKGTQSNPGTWTAGAAISNCKGCHGNQGTGQFGEPDYTSVGTGQTTSNSHAKHATAATTCYFCHRLTAGASAGSIVTGSTEHIDGAVSARLTKVSGFTTFSGVYTPTVGIKTCSATYCHGGLNTTPSWGGSTTCSSCHAASNALLAGHGIHWASTSVPSRYGTYSGNVSTSGAYRFSCSSCHGINAGNHAAGPVRPQATANILFNFTSAGRGLNAYKTYSSSRPTTGTADASFFWTAGGIGACTATYCHSDGQGGNGKNANITWTATSGVIRCYGCHGGDQNAAFNNASTIRTNAHARHVDPRQNSELNTGNGIDCSKCHAKTVSPAYTSFSSVAGLNKKNHVNKMKDYSGANNGKSVGTYAPSTGTGTCTNVYCHSNSKIGTGTLGYYKAPAGWRSGTANMKCNYCHGNITAQNGTGTVADSDTTFQSYSSTGVPVYINSGSAGTDTSNSHKKHMLALGSLSNTNNTKICYNCHAKTLASNTGNVTTGVLFRPYSSRHTNGSYNIAFKPSIGGSYTPGAGSKTCAATSCHGTTNTPQWGGVPRTCDGCHSANPQTATGTNRYWNAYSSAHIRHLEVNTLPTSYATYSGNVSSSGSYRFSCSACHSAARGAVHVGGNATVKRAAEVLFNFTTAGKSGSYVEGTTTRASTDNGFSWTGGTCGNTYCHSDGNGAGPKNTAFNWGSPKNTLRCNGCHGSQDWKLSSAQPAYSSIRTNAHARHVRGDINTELNTGNGLACSRCHGATVSAAMNSYSTVDAGVLNKRRHVNKMKDYSGSTSNPNGGSAYSDGQYNASTHVCSNVYCHSNNKVGISNGTGNIGIIGSPEAWNSGAANRKCNYCHGRNDIGTQYDSTTAFTRYTSTGVPNYNSGTAGSTAANSHRSHIIALGTTTYSDTQVCYNCHSATLDSTTGTSNLNAKFRPYSSRHTNGSYNIKMKPAVGGTYDGTIGTKTCSASSCHGSLSPKWGANNYTADTCTKCHGTPTTTVNVTNRNVVAPPLSVAGVQGQMSGVGRVSNDKKVGAHQTHLLYSNGLRSTAYDDMDNRCGYCHGPLPSSFSTHTHGSSTPAFFGLATSHSQARTYPSYNTSTLVCSNTYCHNPVAAGKLSSGNEGTNVFPSWTGAKYLGGTLPNMKSEKNCNRCHKAPGAVAGTITIAGTSHSTVKISDDCSGCHGHNGDTTGTAGQRHMDGIKYGGGTACNGCHSYDAADWAGASHNYGGQGQGIGAHAKHITYLKSRLGIVLNPTTDYTVGFGLGNAAAVCGVCHTNTLANHTTGDSTAPRTIDFNGATTYQFGPSAPFYNGTYNSSSAASPKSCSNISCHYLTTPIWQTY